MHTAADSLDLFAVKEYLYRRTADSMASDDADTLEPSPPRTQCPSKIHSTCLSGRPQARKKGKVERKSDCRAVRIKGDEADTEG